MTNVPTRIQFCGRELKYCLWSWSNVKKKKKKNEEEEKKLVLNKHLQSCMARGPLHRGEKLYRTIFSNLQLPVTFIWETMYLLMLL